MQENSLLDILDPKVINEAPVEEIIAVTRLTKRCLNLIGKKRPTMKQVAMELEQIKESNEANVFHEQSDYEEDYEIN